MRNPFYVERKTLQQKLKAALENQDQRKSSACVLHGTGGVGKTELIKAYVGEQYELLTYPYQVIVWLDASKSNFEKEFREQANKLISYQSNSNKDKKFSFLTASRKDIIDKFYDLLYENYQSWLLIIDNADEKNTIIDFLPKKDRKNGHIFITSRNPTWKINYEPIEVDIFDKKEEALPYLKIRLKDESEEKIERLAKKLGYLPIALVQATALLTDESELRPTLAEYLDLYEQNKDKYLSYSPTGNTKEQEKTMTAKAVWKTSLNYAVRQFPKVEEMLKVSAYFSPSSIPILIWNKNWRSEEVESAVRALLSCSLIHYANNSKAYDIHPLMQEIAQLENANINTILKLNKNYLSLSFLINWVFALIDWVLTHLKIKAAMQSLQQAEQATTKLSNEKVWIEKALHIIGNAFTYDRNHPDGIEEVQKLLPHINTIFSHMDRLEKAQLNLSKEAIQTLLKLYWQISNYYAIESDSPHEAEAYLKKGRKYAKVIQAMDYQIKYRYLLVNVYILTNQPKKAKTLLNKTNSWIEANKLNVEPIDLAVGKLLKGLIVQAPKHNSNEPFQCLNFYQEGEEILNHDFPDQALIEKSWALINKAMFLVTHYSNQKNKLQEAYDYYDLALKELTLIYKGYAYLSRYIVYVRRQLIELCDKLGNKKNEKEQFKLLLDALLEKREDAYALNFKGVRMEEEEKIEDALKYYQDAHKLDRNNARYLTNQGNILRRLKQYEKALSTYQAALALPSITLTEKAFALNDIGVVLEEQGQAGQLEEALQCYQDAHTLDPNQVIYLYNQGNALRRLKRYDDARAVYEKVLKLPNLTPELKASVLNGIGVVLEEQGQAGQLEAALQCYQDAHTLDPNKALYLDDQGNALRRLKRYDDARAVYEKVLILPNLTPEQKASALNRIGVVLEEQGQAGQLEAALKRYQDAHKLDPNQALYLDNQGNALRRLKRYDDARAVYKKVLILPNLTLEQKASALSGIGGVLEEQGQAGQLEAALQCYQDAHKLDPNNAFYLDNQGNALRRLKRYDDARAVYEKVLIFPNLTLEQKASALNGIGVVLVEQGQAGQLEEALQCYQDAYTLDPNQALYLDNQGNALRRLKRYDDARAVYEKVLIFPNLTPEQKASALNGIGVVLEEQRQAGQLEEALKRLEVLKKAQEIKNQELIKSDAELIINRDSIRKFELPKSKAFLTSRQNVLRDRLYNEEAVKQKLVQRLPNHYQLGAAIGQGDCFFDAIAQSLNALKGSKEYTTKSLRLLCDDYVKSGKHSWVKETIEAEGNNYEQYLVRIPFTVEELEEEEKKNTGLKLEDIVWGRPEIEGRIICEVVNVKLHVIGILEQPINGIGVTEQLVDAQSLEPITTIENGQYDSSDIVHLVNYHNHFVPLLDNNLLQAEKPLAKFTEYVQNNNYNWENIPYTGIDVVKKFLLFNNKRTQKSLFCVNKAWNSLSPQRK